MAREGGGEVARGRADYSLWYHSVKISNEARRSLRAKRGRPAALSCSQPQRVDKACRLGLMMLDGQRRVPPRHSHRLCCLGVPQRLAC